MITAGRVTAGPRFRLARRTGGLPGWDMAALRVRLALLVLLVGTAAAGVTGTPGLVRPLYVAGAVAVAFMAYRSRGLPLHAEVVIVLFVAGPLLRRMVDLHAGFDPAGAMLSAPLLATMVAFPELRHAASAPRGVGGRLTPYAIGLCCIVYAWTLTAFQGAVLQSTVVAVKYASPVLYSVCLLLRPDQGPAVLGAASRCFLLATTLSGIYGICQYLDPQPWDAYWMVAAKTVSMGKPFPFQVRVFSTMNSPVSFAAYATCGLLLFSFVRRTVIPIVLVPFVAILPLCVAILLTGVRTAWIGTAVSLAVCVGFRRTRGRALLLIACLGVGVAGVLTLTSFGNAVSDRISTMSNNVSTDGSGAERLSDYDHVFREDDRYIFGRGLAPPLPDKKMMALDGQLLASAVEMGTTVGIVFVICMVWAGLQAVWALRRDEDPLALVAAAVIIGNIAILPLTAVGVGEVGFLFWFLAGALGSQAGIRRTGAGGWA